MIVDSERIIILTAAAVVAYFASRTINAAVSEFGGDGYAASDWIPPGTWDGDPWSDIVGAGDPWADYSDVSATVVPSQPTEPSQQLIEWLISPLSEGFRASRYLDTSGLWTIGYGHLIKAGEPYNASTVLTREQAYQIFLDDLRYHSAQISAVTVPLTQHQYDALASFGFNAGPAALQYYGVLALLNSYNYDGAVARMAQINNAGVLTTRRQKEANIFYNGVYA